MNIDAKPTSTNALIQRARAALPALADASAGQRDGFLRSLATRLRADAAEIVAANQRDLDLATHLTEPLRERLRLTPDGIRSLASAVEAIAQLPDPLSKIFDQRVLENGLRLHRRRVPLGLLGVIYESRPNVTLDIAALAIKTGNAAVMRGGRESLGSNRALLAQVHAAMRDNELPADAIALVESTDRAEVLGMLRAGEQIDLMIPRGGADLHAFCREHARMPVVTGGIGICHLYVDAEADQKRSLSVIRNAKVQRPTVCNALDTVLVHRNIAATFVPALVSELADDRVELRLDARALSTLPVPRDHEHVRAAGDGDFDREWLSLVLGIAVVDNPDTAIAHIRRHGSGHSDGILTDDADTAMRFLDAVDSAAVYWNASTRFTDGAQFGLGAEVAVSTQRVHARGPMGLEQLTSYKWVIEGDYHVRR